MRSCAFVSSALPRALHSPLKKSTVGNYSCVAKRAGSKKSPLQGLHPQSRTEIQTPVYPRGSPIPGSCHQLAVNLHKSPRAGIASSGIIRKTPKQSSELLRRATYAPPRKLTGRHQFASHHGALCRPQQPESRSAKGMTRGQREYPHTPPTKKGHHDRYWFNLKPNPPPIKKGHRARSWFNLKPNP